ncbi:type II secretion system protein [Candidatus Gottesmanbacteria bacterium]|nr:type II secretion system protein [Candidatus Gottesmanbacteria bacterium]
MRKNQKGFTLIEILVVIGILAVLFAIALVAINPARQFSQANNTKRRSDVNALLNAVHQYAADNKGALPAAITTSALTIGNGTGEADICASVVTKYLAALPRDPLVTGGDVTDCTASYTTNYKVVKSATDNRITVSAPGAELSETIQVTR